MPSIAWLLLIYSIVSLAEAYEPFVSIGDKKHVMGSTHELTLLLKRELDFVNDLKNYVKLLQDEIKQVETFLKTTYPDDSISHETITNVQDYASHPINAYGVVKRNTQLGKENLFQNSELILDKISALKEHANDTANDDDLYTGADAIALLQVSTS